MKVPAFVVFCMVSLLVIRSTLAAEDAVVRELLKAQRVVFLGDSITYSGQYIAYLETYLTTRFPERRFEFIDLGLPSETCSGLSEPGHAGGQFPRPDMHERLGRVLDKLKPRLIVACYGMNCGMYHPLSDERFQSYQVGIRRLREAAMKAGAQVVHLTPPTFDPVPLKGRTLPAGRDSYSQPYEGYNEVLDRYSEWLVSQREQGWSVIDIHGPMNKHLAERRKQTPQFVFANDGVHANLTGHWLMAQQIIAALDLPADASSLKIDGAAVKVISGPALGESGLHSADNASVKKSDDGGMLIEWTARLPMPVDPQWDADSLLLEQMRERFNRQRLTVTGLTAPRYDLRENDKLVETVTAADLQNGLDLTALPKLSTNVRALELFKLIQRRQRLLTDSWLNEVGHKRPGMSKGLPVAEATAQAAPLSEQIAQLAMPSAVKLKLTRSDSATK